MSNVTNLIIATGLGEDTEYLTSQFAKFSWGAESFDIKSIEDKSLPKGWYGGSKLMETTLFIGAFNYLPIDNLIEYLKTKINWNSIEEVQLFIKEQNDIKFRIIELV